LRAASTRWTISRLRMRLEDSVEHLLSQHGISRNG
jgi:hypothetical protein